MDEGSPQTPWIDGRIADGEPLPAGSPWFWLLTVALLVLAVDLTLGVGEPELETAATASNDAVDSTELRARLLAAAEAGDEGRPAFVLVGDSVLAGDPAAASGQRVVDHMRAELGVDSDAELRQIAFDGLLPIDALHLLAELDRVDPDGDVTFVLELDLGDFAPDYAAQQDCTRAALCELGRTKLAAGPKDGSPGGALERATAGLLEAADLTRDWLQRRAPIHRHRPQLREPDLAAVEGLVVPRSTSAHASEVTNAGPSPSDPDPVEARYRDATIDESHAQVVALTQIVDRLRASGRSAALFFTPLDDAFVRATLPDNQLGERQQALAELIHEHGLAAPGSEQRPRIAVLDLDHPLFGAELFVDQVRLGPEGNRLLALNLLHELGLPLRDRPSDWSMVHNEDHDRSLVHRRGLGFADGGANQALLRAPEGVAVSPTGDWIVIADTGNHMLRQLRGSMQIVERLAGTPTQLGELDGPAATATLDHPRSPEIVGETVYFIDGDARERVREVTRGSVDTVEWAGPICDGYDELEARADEQHATLYLLCTDDHVLAVDLDARAATVVFDPQAPGAELVGVRGLEPTDDGRLLLADDDSKIWSLELAGERRARPRLVFDNAGAELLPRAFKSTYPFSFAEMRVNRIIAMEWVDRYHALLIQDEHDLGTRNQRLERELTERVHVRLLDLDNQLIYPWVKAIPHAEAFHMWNEAGRSLVSYFHLGSMAVVQADASLVWVERTRSRVIRLADGFLGAAKAGSLHTKYSKIALLQPINTNSANEISASLRPDRYLAKRHEPIPRKGPYTALIVGSSLSTISDRFCNYSLARWLELELGSELGYRDGIRLDVYLRIHPAASLRTDGNALDDFLSAGGPPPDIALFELHDFEHKYFRGLETRKDRLQQLARIERLAKRYDTLVIFYDNSAIVADDRDGLRATSKEVKELIEDLHKLGILVLEPSDRLLRELLVESPWGNQPWGQGLHHGSPWAIELTAKAFSSIAYPVVREFLRDRIPARERERDPTSFDEKVGRSSLVLAFSQTEGLVDRAALPQVRESFIQTEYEDRKLHLFVDLAGADAFERKRAGYEALAVAVLYAELESEVYGQLAERVTIELLEFENYDEYGEGVREAAAVVWDETLNRKQLEALIRKVGKAQGSK